MNPSVLLFDELADAGRTLVVATHDLATVERLADRQIVIGEDHHIAADRPH
jgi:energy-coupling factor transporter ATP-binding protein EcfA2